MTDEIKQAGVIGLGVMGFDIAFLYAMKGYATLAYDASIQAMSSMTERREQTIERLRRRNRMSDKEVENVRNNLAAASRVEDFAKMDLLTEAVFEAAKAKVAVYDALRQAGFAGILTTNTSSLTRASLLAGGACESKKFASTHFFNPVLHTQMVEVVKGDMEESSLHATLSFLKSLGRAPVETRDISGYVSNSVLMYYAVMAVHLLQRGARIEEVDQAAGELRLLPPFISLDSWKPSIVEDVTRVMFDLRGDQFLRSSKLLSELAQSNPRFYVEQIPSPEIYLRIGASPKKPDKAGIKRALKAAIQVAAARVVELGEDPAKVDWIATEGIKIPQGPLKEIDRMGPKAVLEELEKIKQEMPDCPLMPPELLAAMVREGQTFYNSDDSNPWLLSVAKRKRSNGSH